MTAKIPIVTVRSTKAVFVAVVISAQASLMAASRRSLVMVIMDHAKPKSARDKAYRLRHVLNAEMVARSTRCVSGFVPLIRRPKASPVNRMQASVVVDSASCLAVLMKAQQTPVLSVAHRGFAPKVSDSV